MAHHHLRAGAETLCGVGMDYPVTGIPNPAKRVDAMLPKRLFA